MPANEIELADLRRLAKGAAPDLADAIAAFLEQPDTEPETAPPEGALTVDTLRTLLSQANARYVAADERVRLKTDAWRRFLAQTDPPPPPRFRLAELLVELYESGTDAGRAAVIAVAQAGDLRFGLWGGIKRVYKLAEQRNDAEMFGALAAVFDTARSYGGDAVGPGTLIYLKRRAWRFLRQLGASVPELYPQFAVEVLRHYPEGTNFRATWIANHVWAHESKKYTSRAFSLRNLNDLVKHRAYADAWKRSADPLMTLLESCRADEPARFAIQSLRKDFPDALRTVTPAWLSRLAKRPLASVHEFLVETLQGSPEFHQGKLRGLGLHDTVLSLLASPSDKARAYAIEYARAQAPDLSNEKLAELVASDYEDTQKFAASVLQGRKPRELGYAFLGRLVGLEPTAKWARKALDESFDRKELPESFLLDMVFGSEEQREWLTEYLDKKFQPGEVGPAFWKRVLAELSARRDTVDDEWSVRELAIERLAKFKPAELGAAWLLDALMDSELQYQASQWLLKADALPDLDIERLKGMVFNPRYRNVALEVLGNAKLVKPRDLTLPWLLALARRADPSLHQFAHRYLLEHMKPEDFAEGADREAGIARLFALATGRDEPEPVREFAQTYLRCHHPVIGPEQPESKSFQLKPQLPRKAYTAERVWPALFDPRADVRRFAVAITRAELRAWGYHTRVYELAESEAREVRTIAYEALLGADNADADRARTLTPDELDAARIFALTESRRKSTREVGMELIRRHYTRLGAAERLAWLMESPDREVRMFAIRLLWEKHRPRALPPGWKPRGKGAAVVEDAGRFRDVDALRDFLRRVLFGLPPGRSMEERDDVKTARRIPASVAKRNVVEIVRDLGVEDSAFARLATPVLEEFTGSLAKGEWQACLAALMTLRRAHPSLEFGGLN